MLSDKAPKAPPHRFPACLGSPTPSHPFCSLDHTCSAVQNPPNSCSSPRGLCLHQALCLQVLPPSSARQKPTRFPRLSSLNACHYLVAQSHPTLCNPMDCSPPDSGAHGISQARMLEGVDIYSSRESSPPGIEPTSPALASRFFTIEPPGKHPPIPPPGTSDFTGD